jgi:hypothetical protein
MDKTPQSGAPHVKSHLAHPAQSRPRADISDTVRELLNQKSSAEVREEL